MGLLYRNYASKCSFSQWRRILSAFKRSRGYSSVVDDYIDLSDLEEIRKLPVPQLRERLRGQSLQGRFDPRFRYGQFKAYHVATRYAQPSLEHTKELVYETTMQREYDIVVFGGGVIGSSIAYWLKQRAPEGFTLAVVDRDLQYTHAATTLSVGGIRQQFSVPENIEMAQFGAEFLRNVRHHLMILDDEPPNHQFQPQGHLFLADEKNANDLLKYHALQTDMGSYVEVLAEEQLNRKFPWLRTDDVVLATHGLENEGWFDPSLLLMALKAKAEFLKSDYIEAEIVDFNLKSTLQTEGNFDDVGSPKEMVNHAIIRKPDGSLHQLQFAIGIIALGAESGEFTKRLHIGEKAGFRAFPLPVEPRKRYVYRFNCPDGPSLDFPVMIDSSGVFCRRDGLGGNYICGKSPTEEEEPDSTNLDVDYSYFEKTIHPILKKRVPAFEDIKLLGGWAGYYDYNTFDQNPVIGNHPYYKNVFWATGFGGSGVQMAPAVGRAVMELILDYQFKTIDLTRFGWKRIFINEKINESLLF